MAIASSFASLRPSLLLDFANAKAVDPRITFTRSTTAKYYDGVTTAKAEENLVLSSNSPTLSSPLDVSRTNNAATAPDGTSTAFLIVPTTDNVLHHAGYINQNNLLATTTENLVISFFAKSSGYKNIRVGNTASASSYATFDLDAITVSGTGGGNFVSATITDAGSSWRRCVLVTNRTSVVNFGFIPFPDGATVNSFGQATFAGDGTSGALFWGFQAELRSGSSVTAYTPTTTQPITNYIPVLQTAAAGVPRIDHNPVTGECLGLLIEEQRTNLLTYSEQFDNAAWTKNSSSITANTIVAPDGTLTGDKIVATGNNPYINQLETVTAQSYTVSCFAKAGELPWFRLTWVSNASFTAWFNLSTGVTGTVRNGSASITPVGNGWYRCSYTFTPSATTDSIILGCSTADDTTTGYTGDGYSGVYIWGAQLEAGAFPTSQITTVATQQTRNADAATMTGTNFSSWYNQAEGTLFGDFVLNGVLGGLAQTCWSVSANNTADFITNRTLNNAGLSTVRVGGVNQSDLSAGSGLAVTGNNLKQVTAYKVNDFFAVLNGYQNADTNGTVPVVTQAVIGATGIATVNILNGTIKKIAYYPQRLSNTNLQALTV